MTSSIEKLSTNSELVLNVIYAAFTIFIILICIITFFALFKIKKVIKKRNKFKKEAKNTAYSEEFNQLYYKIKKIHSESFKANTKISKEMFVIISVIIFLLLLIYWLVICANTSSSNDDFVCIQAIFVLVIINIIYFSSNEIRLPNREKYKNIIIKTFIEGIADNISYEPIVAGNDKVEQIYNSAQFDDTNYNRFFVDDCIKDTKNNITMYDIDLRNVIKTSKGEAIDYIFQGMFAYYKLDKNFNSTIKIIRKNNKHSSFNSFVDLDYNEFEKFFDVLCEDRILATSILTADLMEKIVEFSNIFNLTFELTITCKGLYLRFFTSPMFENNDINDKDKLFIYYNMILFIRNITLSISKELNNIDM